MAPLGGLFEVDVEDRHREIVGSRIEDRENIASLGRRQSRRFDQDVTRFATFAGNRKGSRNRLVDLVGDGRAVFRLRRRVRVQGEVYVVSASIQPKR